MKKILFLVLILMLLSGCVRYSNGEPVEDTAEKEIPEENVEKEEQEEDESVEIPPKQSVSEKEEEAPATEPEETSEDWELKINQLAASTQTETEKFDQVMMLGKEYSFSDSEIKSFEEEIVNEFTSGAYLSDIGNHEYMLKNIFKARIVDLHYEDEEMAPIDSFAFDFLQNLNYTYRKVDSVDSDSVLSNEEQMQDTLAEL